MGPVTRFVLTVIVAVLLIALLWWVLRLVALPEPFGTIILIVVLIVVVVYFVRAIPGGTP
jgi:hypothetical protein